MSLKDLKHNAVALDTHPLKPVSFTQSTNTFVSWLSGAGFLINSRGTVIMIDPVISMDKVKPNTVEIGLHLRVPLPIEAKNVPHIDAVLYTHGDSDHVGKQTPRTLAKKNSLFYGTLPVIKNLESLGVQVKQTKTINIGETFKIGQIEITTTPAEHPWQEKNPTKYGDPWGPKDCCGFLIKTEDGTIWCTGDTRLLPEHLQVTGIDVLLLDVSRDDEYHLGPDAATIANKLSDAHLIPYHYGTYDTNIEALNGNPMEVAQSISEWERRLHVLAPGEKFWLGAKEHSDKKY
ncbi:MBL fold metallo-hydrolase [Niallia taxi]|uniref:MBL fold metallo-hydrolase n=1 Tax=Niallia taxi TaxID=2499688 RepID=UPI002E1F8E94|nr:MBL fold metallo-hydrolase [Niallia taxi]